MKQMKKGKGIACLIIFAIILSLMGWYAYSVLTSTVKGKGNNIKLGLDLAGGVSITYQVQGKTPTETQMKDTIYKLQQRIENDLGNEASTTEANVFQVGKNRITIEIPGIKDANAILDQLGTPGKLYFITEKDASGNTNYEYDSSTQSYKLDQDRYYRNDTFQLMNRIYRQISYL